MHYFHHFSKQNSKYLPFSQRLYFLNDYPVVLQLPHNIFSYESYVIRSNDICEICNRFKVTAVCISNANEEIDYSSLVFCCCSFKIKNNCLSFKKMICNISCIRELFRLYKYNLKLCCCLNIYNLISLFNRIFRLIRRSFFFSFSILRTLNIMIKFKIARAFFGFSCAAALKYTYG